MIFRVLSRDKLVVVCGEHLYLCSFKTEILSFRIFSSFLAKSRAGMVASRHRRHVTSRHGHDMLFFTYTYTLYLQIASTHKKRPTIFASSSRSGSGNGGVGGDGGPTRTLTKKGTDTGKDTEKRKGKRKGRLISTTMRVA